MIGDADVGVAVGEQDESRGAAVAHPLAFLDSPEQSTGEIGCASGVDLVKHVSDRGSVADGNRAALACHLGCRRQPTRTGHLREGGR